MTAPHDVDGSQDCTHCGSTGKPEVISDLLLEIPEAVKKLTLQRIAKNERLRQAWDRCVTERLQAENCNDEWGRGYDAALKHLREAITDETDEHTCGQCCAECHKRHTTCLICDH